MSFFRFLNQCSKKRTAWFLLLLVSGAFLFCSLYFQHILLLSPCILCIKQRIAMIGIVVAALLGLLAPKNFLRLLGILIWTGCAIFGLTQAMSLVSIQFHPSIMDVCPLFIDYPNWLPLQQWFPAIFSPSGHCADRVWQFLSLEMSQWMVIIFSCYLFVAVLVIIAQFIKPKRNWWYN